MIFVKNSRGGREVNMINTLSKIGWEGGRSTSLWIMSLNILGFFWRLPLRDNVGVGCVPPLFSKNTVCDMICDMIDDMICDIEYVMIGDILYNMIDEE